METVAPPPIPSLKEGMVKDVPHEHHHHKRRRRRPSKEKYSLPQAFLDSYTLHEELGRGAFAIVRRCTCKATGKSYACKVIDLRPIRMRESIKMERVNREVQILKTISHQNIVKLHDVFESESTLAIVMEYIKGRELFFMILEKNHYSEDLARPIFRQLAESLSYLHSHNIVHRDIKPENVLIVDGDDDDSGISTVSNGIPSRAANGGAGGLAADPSSSAAPYPIVKLLDFGLSKLIDPTSGGSSAKTFVGTRAYLAPEVELRAHGQGREYGSPADCWSLGAVLHVMLVARFPEFDVVHKIGPEGNLTPFSGVLKVEGLGLWDHLSCTVKDLIKRLMTPNAERRMTAAEALEHPWTKGMSCFPTNYTSNARDHGPIDGEVPNTIAEQGKCLPNGNGTYAVGQQEAVEGGVTGSPAEGHHPEQQQHLSRSPCRTANMHLESDPISAAPVELRLGLLVKIQQWIATALGVAFQLMVSKTHASDVAYCVRTGAIVCRHELHLTIKLLRKVYETAGLVLAVFPDLTLALKEGELVLAQSFFASIKSWLSEIRKEVQDVQRSNEQATVQMSRIIKKAARQLVAAHKLIQYREKERKNGRAKDGDDVKRCRREENPQTSHAGADEAVADRDVGSGGGKMPAPPSTAAGQATVTMRGIGGGALADSGIKGPGGSVNEDAVGRQEMNDEEILDALLPSVHCDETYPIDGEYDKKVEELADVLNDLLPAEAVQPTVFDREGHTSSRQLEDRQMAQVVICLRRLDRILERLDSFWARCEVDLEIMLRRGDHIRNLIAHAQTPEMVCRLNMRLTEYATFWQRVSNACSRYLSGVNESTVSVMYQYLDDGGVELPGPDTDIAVHTTDYDSTDGGTGTHSLTSLQDDMDQSGDSAVEESNDEREDRQLHLADALK